MNCLIGGIVASPTPTVPIASDSTNTTLQPPRTTSDSAAAAIHPADRPPTITIVCSARDEGGVIATAEIGGRTETRLTGDNDIVALGLLDIAALTTTVATVEAFAAGAGVDGTSARAEDVLESADAETPDGEVRSAAAIAVTRHVEAQTGWSIRRFVQTARRYRTVEIRAGQHLLTAEDPLPTDLRDALAMII